MSKYGLTVGGHGVMDGIHIYIYIAGLYKWVSLFMYELYNNEISIWSVLI